MTSEFVQLQASDEGDLRHFLCNSFETDPGHVPFRADVLRWKYFADHPQWNGSRSYAIRRDSAIVAHGGVWPVTLLTPYGELKAIHLIDWAANRSAAGAGVQLLRHVAQLGDVLLSIGGSSDTRTILPKLGYKQYGELRRYARVVRPWLQFRTSPRRNLKTALKCIRNSTRALRPIPSIPHECPVSQISSFSEIFDSREVGQIASSVASRRTTAGLGHLLSCPAGRFSGFVVNSERSQGYFVLAQIGRQTRIVDMGGDAKQPESWRALCLLAAHTAAQNTETCEIVAASSTEQGDETWLQLGFTRRQTEPILCFDPRKLLNPRAPLDLKMADGDLCFLSDPTAPYLC